VRPATVRSSHAQLAACSGKKARWRNAVKRPWKRTSFQESTNRSGGGRVKRQRPASSSSAGSKTADALLQVSSGRRGDQKHWGSGRTTWKEP
jgi:hypothetical protein